MYQDIHSNLHRQFKALELLESLLEEEYLLLEARDTEAVAALEFSIHELLRQIAYERVAVKTVMQGTRLVEYAGMLPEEDGKEITKLCKLIDSLEQRCSRTASRNAELSLALMDQSHRLLAYLHEQIAPKHNNVYGAAGKVVHERPGAALISGRL